MEKLPKNWVSTELRSVARIVTGGTPKKSQNKYYGKDFLWVKPGDLNEKTYIEDTEEKLSSLGFEASRLVPKDSVLVTCIGNLGRVGIASEDLATNQQINSIVIEHNLINKKFMYYSSLTLKKWLVENSTSTTISMVNKSNFETSPFLFPPLPEQERIVAKLDALFSSIDIINSKIQRIENLNEIFFESVFYNNSGQKTLERLLIESKDRAGKDWNKYRKIGVSTKKGIIDLDTGTKTSFENYKIVQPGEFIYNTMRIDIGSIAIYEDNIPAITSPDYVVFRVENISKYLLLNYLKSEIGRKNISSLTTGSVRSRLYFKSLIQLPFPIIPSEQHNKAESILKWFNSNIKKLWFLRDETLINLKETILHKAFKGELVPQFPTDGDAKDLLEEILKLKKEVKKK